MHLKRSRALAWAPFLLTLFVAPTAQAGFKLGLVLSKGGKDDKSFNASAYQGGMKAKTALKVDFDFVEPKSDAEYEPALRDFAKRGYDLVVGVGVTQADAVQKVAADFPSIHFAIVDAEVNAPNVRSILFEENHGAFLVGAIAGLMSKAGRVGFVGGMDIPLIRRFEAGFFAGAKHTQPKIKTEATYVGRTPDAWNDPAKAKAVAAAQLDHGADIIFAAAGGSNAGVFDAAAEKKRYAIGVDSDQGWMKPGTVLTSMVKRVDIGLFMTCAEAVAGSFKSGTRRFGLDTQGVDFVYGKGNEMLLPRTVHDKIQQIKVDILARQIKVPDVAK